MPVGKTTKRLIALALGAALVIALGAFAISGDLGDPDVPDGNVAVVENAPNGDITQEEYKTALDRAAFQLNLSKVPPPSNPQYEQIKQSALTTLIQTRWVEGEAADRGIEVSERDVDQQLEQVKKQQLGGEKGYQQFIKQSPYDADAVREVARLGVISGRVQAEAVSATPPDVSDTEVNEFYQANISQYQQPATHDVREIVNPIQAKVEEAMKILEQDDSAASWKKVAKKYSTDDATKNQGGLRKGVVEGQTDPAIDAAIDKAPLNQLVGPIKAAKGGYYVIEVLNTTPATTTPLSKVSDQIRQTLQQGLQTEAATRFRNSFVSKWTERTFCAEGYVIDICANAPAPTDACPVDDQSERDKADPKTLDQGCEAPVTPRAVVDPGTAVVFPGSQAPVKPQGPQRLTPITPSFPGGALPLGTPGAPTTPSTGAPPPGG